MASPDDIKTLLVVFGVIAVLFLLMQATRRPRRARSHRWDGPRPVYRRETQITPPSGVPDAADQLRAVEHATYGRQPLLRFQERQVFAAAESAVHEVGMPWRVFAQVSLGEVLTCPDREGFNAINAKRVDLLITDARFTPLAAIEYQGTGHHLGKAAARDAIKKEALRKAGIGYIEINHDHGPDDVRREIARLAFTHVVAADGKARRVARG